LGKREFLRKLGLRQFLVIMNAYHHAKNQKKTNKPIARKVGNRQTNGQTSHVRTQIPESIRL